MSYNPTFPAEFYEKNGRMLYTFAISLIFLIVIFKFIHFDDPLGIKIMAIILTIVFIPMALFSLKLLIFPKPTLIIERYQLTTPYFLFWQQSIKYRDIHSFDIESYVHKGIEQYIMTMNLKSGEIKSLALTEKDYQGTLYNAKEIYHLIIQAHKGEKLNYQGVDMGESRGFYTL